MRKRVYQYPKKRWVQDTITGLWHSVERTKIDIDIAKQAISDMTFVPFREIKWVPNHQQFIVFLP